MCYVLFCVCSDIKPGNLLVNSNCLLKVRASTALPSSSSSAASLACLPSNLLSLSLSLSWRAACASQSYQRVQQCNMREICVPGAANEDSDADANARAPRASSASSCSRLVPRACHPRRRTAPPRVHSTRVVDWLGAARQLMRRSIQSVVAPRRVELAYLRVARDAVASLDASHAPAPSPARSCTGAPLPRVLVLTVLLLLLHWTSRSRLACLMLIYCIMSRRLARALALPRAFSFSFSFPSVASTSAYLAIYGDDVSTFGDDDDDAERFSRSTRVTRKNARTCEGHTRCSPAGS